MTLVDERNYITNEFNELGNDLVSFVENTKPLSLKAFCQQGPVRHQELLLVDTQTLLSQPDLIESFKIIMNTYLGVIFFHDEKNQEAQAWIENHSFFLNKIVGNYSFPMKDLDQSILRNQFMFFQQLVQDQKKLQLQMVNFSQELDKVLQNAELEMITAKKIHETLLPKRKEEVRGLKFLNKYSVGDSNGGEFFDLITVNHVVYQIFISSDSYLVSSALIGMINDYKSKGFSPDQFIKDAREEIATINSSKKKSCIGQIAVFEIDTNQLTMKFYGDSSDAFSSMTGEIDFTSPYQLKKDESLVLMSPGFVSNWTELQIKPNIYEFLNSNKNMNQAELLTELFLQESIAKKDQSTKDATVVMIEVNRHGIHQV